MCFAKVISINNQLKYVLYIICSVQWLLIYPIFIGVCLFSSQCTSHTHTNKDWINMQPLDRRDSVNDVF